MALTELDSLTVESPQETQVPQETEVSVEESGETKNDASERSQEENELDRGESLPICVYCISKMLRNRAFP